MENSKPMPQVKQGTLMQAFERLENKCLQLSEVANLTERLNEKLNRTEGNSKCEDVKGIENSSLVERNIVELFNLIAEKMETQINVIGNNTDKSMQMID
jgi:hypothetical protein